MRGEYAFGIRLAIGARRPDRSWPELLFDAMEQLQRLSLTDVKLRDVLAADDDYPWPGKPPHSGEYVCVAEPPDVLGPETKRSSRALLGRLDSVGRTGMFDLIQAYPEGALCVPWIQTSGELTGGALQGIWCMPLHVLTTLAGAQRGQELIQFAAETCFPIAIAPSRAPQRSAQKSRSRKA